MHVMITYDVHVVCVNVVHLWWYIVVPMYFGYRYFGYFQYFGIVSFWGRFSWDAWNREKHDYQDLRFCRFCRFHGFHDIDMFWHVVVVKSVNKHVHQVWHGLWYRVQSTSILVSCFDDIMIVLFGVLHRDIVFWPFWSFCYFLYFIDITCFAIVYILYHFSC